MTTFYQVYTEAHVCSEEAFTHSSTGCHLRNTGRSWSQHMMANNKCVWVKRVIWKKKKKKKESVRKQPSLYIFPRNALFKPSPGGSDNYKVEYKKKTEKDALRQEKTEGLWVKSL